MVTDMDKLKKLTLGSLFSGSGGFELGGILAGIEPIWNSDVEPFAIRVTTKRLPNVKHYGDVSALRGSDLEPVDIITFGSPCQDMSIAGKRAGLDGSKSSLFYEAVRIIKEMREKTNGEKPKWIVWENVTGAFSSGGGEDFRQVLQEIIRIKEPNAEVPPPDPKGWPYADTYLGDGWSVAYRTLDAQYFGVPQRRRRIYLVGDLAGSRAGEVLFKSEGVSGYSPQSFRSWEGASGNSKESTGETGGITAGGNTVTSTLYAAYGTKWNGNTGALNGDNFVAEAIVLNDQGGERMDITNDKTNTLRAQAHHPPVVMEAAGFCTEHSAKARNIGYEEEKSPTLRAGVVPAAIALEHNPMDSRIKISEDGNVQTLCCRAGTGGNNVPLLMEEDLPITLKIRSGCEGCGKGPIWQEDKSAALGCNNDQTLFVPESCSWDGGQVSPTLTKQNASGSQRMPDKDNFNCVLEADRTAFGISSFESHAMLSDNPHAGIYEAETSRTLDVGGSNPTCNQGGVCVVEKQSVYSIQGSMIGRDDKNGPQGDGINEDVSFTLNTTDRHAVYAMTTGSYTHVEEECAPTLMARDYKDPTAVAPVYGIGRDAFNQGTNAKFAPSIAEEVQPTLVAKGPGAVVKPEPVYTVRRLTPTECARLQGFPDWWCSDLGTENPTEEELVFWRDVFETHRRVITHTEKPKTDAQIRKWLKNPYSDSAEYKLWGNGVALPCVYFVMSGIVWADGLE